MDPVLEAAARALAGFDPLGALKRIALREEPPALAMRGVAMAQLGDYPAARKLLGRAARAFERTDPRARARCLAASGEVALASRDLKGAVKALDEAAASLDAYGDRQNALFVRLQRIRTDVLLGNVTAAREQIRSLNLRGAPPRLRALADLVAADIAMRSLDPSTARAALARARQAATIPSIADEVGRATRELAAPVARVVSAGVTREANLDDVSAVLASSRDLVVDACRRVVRLGRTEVSLVTRPVLLALAVGLGEASPEAAPRDALARQAFGVHRTSDSTRVRMRVEIGRLRQALAAICEIEATGPGYAMIAKRGARVVVVLPPAPGEASALLALLRGGESWSTSDLASAIGSSQRTVQRALVTLRDEGRALALGQGRAQRWLARPPEGFATTLLLVARPSRV